MGSADHPPPRIRQFYFQFMAEGVTQRGDGLAAHETCILSMTTSPMGAQDAVLTDVPKRHPAQLTTAMRRQPFSGSVLHMEPSGCAAGETPRAYSASINASAVSTPRSTSLREMEGTRLLWRRLCVPQWEQPDRPRAVSHAAVLFDIAYAAALAHHAYVLVHVRRPRPMWEAVGIYVLSAAPTVWQWWAISLFLCRFDPGEQRPFLPPARIPSSTTRPH